MDTLTTQENANLIRCIHDTIRSLRSLSEGPASLSPPFKASLDETICQLAALTKEGREPEFLSRIFMLADRLRLLYDSASSVFTPESSPEGTPVSGIAPHEDRLLAETALHQPSAHRETSPLIVESQQAFRRELPKLLEEHAEGAWVAYRGSERSGVGPSKDALYNECLQKGLKRGEFLVRLIDRSNLFESEVIDMSPEL